MNNPLDPTLRELDACGCCAGTSAQTPSSIENRPGLPTVAYRAGVHSQFKATLLAALSSQDYPALRGLHTRASDDFTIALLDAFASTADVLTFYSERIANEAYLGTAMERRSVLELARAIGYELAPGVAAGVMLSFTVEGGTGAPGTAIIAKGTKVQSIPGPDEKPQVFETPVEFNARAAWNELRPRLRSAPLRGSALLDTDQLFLAGTGTNLRPGDVLVLSDGATAHARRVASLTVDRDRDHTHVTLEQQLTTPVRNAPAAPPEAKAINASAGKQPTAETVGGLFLNATVSSHEMFSLGYFKHWDMVAVQDHLNKLPKVALSTSDAGVFALRNRVGFFGHNAPKWKSLPLTKIVTTVVTNPPPPAPTTSVSYRNDVYPRDWDGISTANLATKIWQDSQGDALNSNTSQFDVLLERPVPEAVVGNWIVLESDSAELVPLRVGRNLELSLADYGMSGKCARVNLKGVDGVSNPSKKPSYNTRGTTAHVHSEPLNVIGSPIVMPLQQGDTRLPLDCVDKDLKEGQVLALKGENADLPGTIQREMIAIAKINHSIVTTLTLRKGLEHNYIRATVTLHANVVPATHGDTTQEVLGSGDAAQLFQRFTLKQKPLTYAFPLDAGQLASSLEIWVDDVRWREVATFFKSGPKDRVYVVRLADDGTTTVQFGDGRRGARLPTGRENVSAVYRKGIGLDGMVKEEQLSLLLTQPLGVKGVTNLLAPQGAEEPQSLDDARVNAPRTVLTLDRVVSLQDYEDFARDFPDVDKAHAAWTWSGQTRGVLLTLLGPEGLAIDKTGQPAGPLRRALANQGIARVPVRIVSQPPSLFAVTGIVRVESDRIPSKVEAEVKTVLRATFSFAAREFGQGVALSELIAVIQNVPGIAFIDVADFRKTSLVSGAAVTTAAVDGYLTAYKPANGADSMLAQPAELLILDEMSLPQLEVQSL